LVKSRLEKTIFDGACLTQPRDQSTIRVCGCVDTADVGLSAPRRAENGRNKSPRRLLSAKYALVKAIKIKTDAEAVTLFGQALIGLGTVRARRGRPGAGHLAA